MFSLRHAFVALALAASVALGQPRIKPNYGIENNIYPSWVLSTATLNVDKLAEPDPTHFGDRMGLFGAEITPDKPGQKVTVSFDATTVFPAASLTVTLPEAGTKYVVAPKLKWNYEVLKRVTQSEPVDVTLRVKVGDGEEQVFERTVQLCSRNICVAGVRDAETMEYTPIPFSWAGYVNEDHPWVDGVLRAALDTGIVTQFDGFQSNNPDKVLHQVYAIWNVLQQRNVQYSSITETASETHNVYSQHVRFIDESIEFAQANCVDGSVAFASLLRKIGLNPKLMLVPGHMYVCFDMAADGSSIYCLETTMLGHNSKARHTREDIFGVEMFDQRNFDAESWRTFEAATNHANAAYNAAITKFNNDPQYQVIDIKQMRLAGIRPIPYVKPEAAIAAPTAPVPAAGR